MTAESAPDAQSAARPRWVDDALFPFESRYLDIDGNRVHYIDEGTGPVVLLLHGNPAWSFLFRHTISALASSRRCIALDYPGFGLSSAAAAYGFSPPEHAAVVAELVSRLDLSEITLVIGDWGGPIGLSAAASDANRYSNLVITNTWAWPITGDRHFEVFSRIMGGRVGTSLIRRFNLFVNVLVPKGHARTRLSRDEMSQYRGPFPTPDSRLPTAILPRAITGESGFLAEVEAGLDSLSHLPVVIVWGEKDFAFRSSERERFEGYFANHRTVTIADAGHFLADDAPGELIEAINTTAG